MGSPTALEPADTDLTDIDGIERAVERHVAGLEAAFAAAPAERLSGRQAARLVERTVALERLAAATKTRYAKRVADTRAFETTGHHDAASWLAGVSGESTGAAKGVLTLADKLAQAPLVDQAFGDGRLSAAQATVVAGAGALDPSAQAPLLESAEQASFRELRDAASRVTRQALGEASELAKERRAHEQRCLRLTPTAHGGVRLSGRLTRLDGARVASVLDVERQQVVKDVRTAGHRTRDEAHLADALVRVVCGDPATRPRAQVTVQADLAALDRGSVEGDEVCEIPGVGSIPVAVAQDLLGDAWVELVLRQGTDVTTITSKKRTIPTAVRTALWARDGGRCVVPGCPHTRYLQIDHDWAFARGGPTELANIQLLCTHHHRQKTLYGFRMVRGNWVGPAARAGPGP